MIPILSRRFKALASNKAPYSVGIVPVNKLKARIRICVLADVISGGAPVSKLLSNLKLDSLGSKPSSETKEPLMRALLASTSTLG